MQQLKSTLFLLLLFPICLFLSFNKHSKDKANSYHGVIWADAAGYYVYQPMWFIYGNNASAFPDSIDINSGNGFQLDHINNKIKAVVIYSIPLLIDEEELCYPGKHYLS